MGLTAKLVLKALETGIVPERISRAWVRYLCSQAIDRASLGDVEARHAVFRQVLKELKLGAMIRNEPNAEDSGGEMGPEFYELFLGKRLNSGCCYFPTGAEDLDEAEDTMLWMSADRAHIRDGMKILEIGCGWGAMTFWLAEQFPMAHITAIAESTSRAIHLQKRLKELELNNVRVVAAEFQDLNFSAEFDRVICIERFDLIAPAPAWDSKIKAWLKPDGKLFLQHQVHSACAYYQESAGLGDIPGNSVVNLRMVPSAEMLCLCQKAFMVEDYWKISGEQYKKTAERWLNRYYFNRLAILPLFEKVYGKKMAWTWLQRWRLYLIALAEQSGFNRGQEWIISQYLMG
ncbi:MAG TPA: class I SAM-dependent methyltransferase [Candidatus Rifleibacterium sp.]|nr:class I SAM-dependent methyltransferase [Candidatus Rifleibacterium sp.]HPT46106.1 class I SAM-dependent methyltransferase [Candidatus Rifleibacterium sp.]